MKKFVLACGLAALFALAVTMLAAPAAADRTPIVRAVAPPAIWPAQCRDYRHYGYPIYFRHRGCILPIVRLEARPHKTRRTK